MKERISFQRSGHTPDWDNIWHQLFAKGVCSSIPRPKGSKNKSPKKVKITSATGLATLIADKSSAKEALAAEITTLTSNLSALKAELKDKTAALKAIDKELAKLEAQKAEADAKAAEEVKKAELGEYAGRDGAIRPE